jgi:hypothetical protein
MVKSDNTIYMPGYYPVSGPSQCAHTAVCLYSFDIEAGKFLDVVGPMNYKIVDCTDQPLSNGKMLCVVNVNNQGPLAGSCAQGNYSQYPVYVGV